MATISPPYAAPFDSVAEEYDRTFITSNIGRAQRAAVWKYLTRAFRPGDRVLEIGCGTGVDACFLAQRGVTVVACDSSQAMIAVAEQRLRAVNAYRVQPRVLAAENLASLGDAQNFDGAFSNFGVLNCIDDLRVLAKNLARLLKPGATFLSCLMGPHCAWEMLWYLAHGNPRKAFRRFASGKVTARLAATATVSVHYPSVSSLISTFSPDFRLQHWKGIGLTVPPSYLEKLVSRHPTYLRWMIRADTALEKAPLFRGWADHILLSFERAIESGGSQ